MLSCTFMYWATIRLLPFHTMSIGLYTTLTNTIFFFLASYTTFSASSNCCKIYIIFHFIVLFNFKFSVPYKINPELFTEQYLNW